MAGLLWAGSAWAQETVLPELREAAKKAPTDVGVQVALGRALIEAGRMPEAEAQMRAAVRLSKSSIETMYDAMRVKFASESAGTNSSSAYSKARAGCQDLVKKDPKHVLSQVCMARAFLLWRRSSRAQEFIDK